MTIKNISAPEDFGTPLRPPRIGVYQSWTANIDEGWTRLVLDQYEFPYTTLHNADIAAGRLRARFDAIVLPDQTAKGILEGQTSAGVPAEYRGGLGDKGWQALKDFADQGGTLISFGDACNLLVDKLPLPVKELKRGILPEQHDGPGTILNLQVDTASPLGWGMAPATFGFYLNSPFFDVTEGFGTQKVRVVARYPNVSARGLGLSQRRGIHAGPGRGGFGGHESRQSGAVRHPAAASRPDPRHLAADLQRLVLVGGGGSGRCHAIVFLQQRSSPKFIRWSHFSWSRGRRESAL